MRMRVEITKLRLAQSCDSKLRLTTEQAQPQTGPTSDQSQGSAGKNFPVANFTVGTVKPVFCSSVACRDAPDEYFDGANDIGEVSLQSSQPPRGHEQNRA